MTSDCEKSAEVASRLMAVRSDIGQAAVRAGRSPTSVRLVAVSKYHSIASIKAALAAGQRDFAENYAQELAHKAAALAAAGHYPTWHFTGRLQRNKVATVVQWARVIHSVDSLRLAEAISRTVCARQARGQSVANMAIFLQVNFEADTRRAGVAPSAVATLAQAVVALPGLELWGLMALPAASRSKGALAASSKKPAADVCFEALADLQKSVHKACRRRSKQQLSMGMSHDFASAIAAGATLVRIGTAIFGPRPPRRSAP